MSLPSPKDMYDGAYHAYILNDILERMFASEQLVIEFVKKAHEIAYSDYYRDQDKQTSSEYLAKAIDELRDFFDEE